MKIVLLATYEMGHQPLSLAWPLAALQAAGFDALAYDLSVQDFPEKDIRNAKLVAISVPMLTAMRLGVETAKRIRQTNPAAHICFYGLYAHHNAVYLRDAQLADSVLAGELEPELVRLAEGLDSPVQTRPTVLLERINYPIPQRADLPGLDVYARLDIGGELRLAGYTEATRGCLHTCTHCPVVPVYQGRFFAVPVDVVLADVRRQVAMGAEHITFGDPDFLNGPTHALRVAQAVHAAFPNLTFDFTAKVEHLIEHQAMLPELVRLGALYVISAFESTSDRVLDRLAKGHRGEDLDEALRVCRSAGLSLQPTWVAFTPWTMLEDYIEMLQWVRSREMIPDVPVVQFAVRLLVPPHSSMLEGDEEGFFGELDPENFTHVWQHPDPRMDELHRFASDAVENACGRSQMDTFFAIEEMAFVLADLPIPVAEAAVRLAVPAPRLTEDWFC